MTKSIGEKICELRKSLSLTQEKLGEQLGISNQAVSKWENGDAMPDILILPKLCKILGITVDALLEVEKPINRNRDSVLMAFRDYALETGASKALLEAFICTSQIHEYSTNIRNTLPDSIPELDQDQTIRNKWSIERMELLDSSGMGFVIANNEYKDKIRDYNIEQLTKYFEIFANVEIMTVVSELLHAGHLSKVELIEKTNYPLDTINVILLTLMERTMCIRYYDKSIDKTVYTVTPDSSSFHMALTAYYCTLHHC